MMEFDVFVKSNLVSTRRYLRKANSNGRREETRTLQHTSWRISKCLNAFITPRREGPRLVQTPAGTFLCGDLVVLAWVVLWVLHVSPTPTERHRSTIHVGLILLPCALDQGTGIVPCVGPWTLHCLSPPTAPRDDLMTDGVRVRPSPP